MSAKVVLLYPNKMLSQGRVFHKGKEVTVPDDVAKYLRENLDGHFEIDFTAAEAPAEEAASEEQVAASETDGPEQGVAAEAGGEKDDAKTGPRKGGVRINKGGAKKAEPKDDDGDAVEL